MADFTPNYNLKKPLRTEYYNVADANGNSDIVDTQLKAVNDRVGLVEGEVDALELGKVDKVVGKQLSDENYTLIEKNKLAGVEENATADMTALEIKTEYESNTDTNAYTDAEKAKVTNLPADTNAQLADIAQDVVDLDTVKASKSDIGLLSGLLTTAKTSIVAAINELFNSKANKAQEAWRTPTLLNGWVPVNEATQPQYMIDDFGFVHFRGAVKDGVVGQPIFNVIAGYRSSQILSIPISANSAFGRIYTDWGGNIILANGANALVFLNPITYKAGA